MLGPADFNPLIMWLLVHVHMPVVRHDGTGDAREPVVHCMRWGLVPSFTKKSEKPDFYRMVSTIALFSYFLTMKNTFMYLESTSFCD